MSSGAFGDLIAALALMLVFEGVALAIASGRIGEMLAMLQEMAPEQLRWLGLGMAVGGTALYVLIRG